MTPPPPQHTLSLCGLALQIAFDVNRPGDARPLKMQLVTVAHYSRRHLLYTLLALWVVSGLIPLPVFGGMITLKHEVVLHICDTWPHYMFFLVVVYFPGPGLLNQNTISARCFG